MRACRRAKFDTHKLKARQPLPPKPGEAVIYFISKVDFGGFPLGCGVVNRGGIDGHWLGATCGSSWLAAYVSPGMHHLCGDMQSVSPAASLPTASLTRVNAEAGHNYFFLEHVLYTTGILDITLDRIDPDEGRLLIATLPESGSHPK